MGRSRRDTEIGVPHHIAHRGNHRQAIFADEADCRYYLSLLHRFSRMTGTRIGAFCLMPNHVHVVAVPSSIGGLSDCFGRTHRKYSEHLNRRQGTRGTNWEGRFFSAAMGLRHTFNALRYIERNPVEAKLVSMASEWRWSSAGSHCCQGERWPLLNIDLRGELADPVLWREKLGCALTDEELQEVEWASVCTTLGDGRNYAAA